MNWMMLMPVAEKLLGSGALDGLLGKLQGGQGDALKGLVREQATPAAMTVNALTVLADQVPADPARARAFLEGLTKVLEGAAQVKAAMRGDG